MFNYISSLASLINEDRIHDATNLLTSLSSDLSVAFNVHGRRLLGHTEVTSGLGGLSSVSYIPSYDTEVNVPSNRLVRVEVLAAFTGPVGSSWELQPTMDGVGINRVGTYVASDVAGVVTVVYGALHHSPSPGPHTYGLAVVRRTGTGTATHNASVSRPGMITVEDSGPYKAG